MLGSSRVGNRIIITLLAPSLPQEMWGIDAFNWYKRLDNDNYEIITISNTNFKLMDSNLIRSKVYSPNRGLSHSLEVVVELVFSLAAWKANRKHQRISQRFVIQTKILALSGRPCCRL